MHILGSLPGRKALIYFAGRLELPGADDQAELRRTIDAAVKSNVAIYTIDAREVAPEIMPQFTQGVVPAERQPAQVALQDEQNRRAVGASGVVQGTVHLDWPPPLAKYQSDRAADAAFPGLPSGHFTVKVRPAGDYQTIEVPIGGYSGQVQITGQIKSLANTSHSAVGFGDLVQSSTGAYEASIILEAGPYICSVLVTEQATGQTYGETVIFEVK